MNVPYRNCELSRKEIRTTGDFELDYARGWMLYSRTSHSGICSGNRNNRGDEAVTPLARYDRYKIDYTIVSRSVIERRSVETAQECANECDRYRSQYECQAFAFT